MYLILLVLHDAGKLGQVLDAWEAAGVSGVTVLVSSGLGRLRRSAGYRDDLPVMPALKDFFQPHEGQSNRTLFTVVPDETVLDRIAAVTQAITGDLRLPETGMLAALPLARYYGT
jgi:hypothetical protein